MQLDAGDEPMLKFLFTLVLNCSNLSDRQTDIRTQATYDPHGRVFLMCYSQWYEGAFCTTNFSYVNLTHTDTFQTDKFCVCFQ